MALRAQMRKRKKNLSTLLMLLNPVFGASYLIHRFCHPIDRECQLLEYQCDDYSSFLHYDRTSRQVLQDDLEGVQSSTFKRRSYSLRSNAKPDPAVEP